MTPTQPANTSQSFEKSAIPLFLALKPSRILRTLSVTCHVLAAVAVFLSNIPLAIQLMLSIAVVVSLCYNHRQDSHEQLLIWRAGNRWVIETALPSSTNSQHEADQEAEFPQNHVQNQTTRPAQGPIRSTDNLKPVAAELKSIDFFSRWLVILTLHTEAGRNEKYVIASDSLSENTFRLLRVRLRIEGFILLNPEKKPEA